jgi:hypothetical protein
MDSTAHAASTRREIARRTPYLAALVALAAIALIALAPSGSAGAKKHKHHHKRHRAGLIASDTGADPNPDHFWGRDYCANSQRLQQITTGGDPHLTATGAPQGNSAFRRTTVFDGDNAFGERCELGWDNVNGPTAFYRPNKHRITELSIRLPSNFPLNVFTWQSVMQMKQAGPANNSGGAPILELDAWGGRWRLRQALDRTTSTDLRELWSAPAQLNFWTRFLFNIRYSANPRKGFIRVGVDLNGDGDFADPGERSRRFHTYTLKVETPGGGDDGINPGQAIPSHLRAGIYHNSSIPCPSGTGCSVDIDNVQVLRP